MVVPLALQTAVHLQRKTHASLPHIHRSNTPPW